MSGVGAGFGDVDGGAFVGRDCGEGFGRERLRALPGWVRRR